MKALSSKCLRQGFTILETVGTMSIMTVAVALGLSGYIFMQEKSQKECTQTELDLDLRMATQKLQDEMRLSSLNEMLFHPMDSKKYTAVSFPVNLPGSLSKTNGIILWDATVIYHVSTSTSDAGEPQSKLLRTVFSNRNNSLSTAERQDQLEQVVSDGNGIKAVASGETVATTCLFEHVFNWEIIPKGSLYDGYAAQNTLDNDAYLGSFNLDGGEHTIQFKVIGKDSKSQGYRIGIDNFSFSHAQGILEAEDQTVDGDLLPMVESDQGYYSNYRKLMFDATQEGDSFEIKVYNDRWEDTLFDTIGSIATNNVTCGYDPDYTPPEVTLRLKGSTTNQFAINQTGDEAGLTLNDETFRGAIVRTLIKGEAIESGANAGITHEGAGCRLAFFCSHQTNSVRRLKIKAAYIDECSSRIAATPDTIGNPTQITFNGGASKCLVSGPDAVWSDLLDYPINPKKNYAVTFSIQQLNDLNIHPKTWASNTNLVNSYHLPNDVAETADLTASSWSSNSNIVQNAYAVGVGEIFVSYPAVGVYLSAPFDTHMQRPQYESVDWAEDSPLGSQLKIEVRTASKPDMSDASNWKYVSSPGNIGLDYLQYLQYRATLTASDKGDETPKLKKIKFQWLGEMSATHLTGSFMNGPDFGQFKTLIDGQELTSPLRISLEVKKHPFGGNTDSDGTMISETSFELTPRNSN